MNLGKMNLGTAFTNRAAPRLGRRPVVKFLALGAVLMTFSRHAWAEEDDSPANGLVPTDPPRPVPDFSFSYETLSAVKLSDFRGRVVLLNLWGPWCPPCRIEMPSLDRLQAALGGPRFEVVAVAIERRGRGPVHDFYDELGLRRLKVYVDTSKRSVAALDLTRIPVSILIDPDGREVARVVGPISWDDPAVVAFIRRYLPGR